MTKSTIVLKDNQYVKRHNSIEVTRVLLEHQLAQ